MLGDVIKSNLRVTNVDYDLVVVDAEQFKFEFTSFEYNPVIRIKLPIMNAWKVAFDYQFQEISIFDFKVPWWIPLRRVGAVAFDLSEINMESAFNLRAEDNGSLSPMVKSIDLSLGKTHINIKDDSFTEWFANECLAIGKVLLQNSVNLLGWPLISVSGGPVLSQLLQNYQYDFELESDTF